MPKLRSEGDYRILTLRPYKYFMHPEETPDALNLSKVRRRSASWIAALAFVWFVLDLNLANTILVTPVSNVVWWSVTIIGSVAGLQIGYMIADGEVMKPLTHGRTRKRASLIALCAIGLLFGAAVGIRIMWRITNVVCFWGSTAPVTVEAFPIRSVSVPRGAPVVSIGSEGEQDSLPISKRDLKLLRGVRRLQRPWTYCLNLSRQEQGDAVRVWLPRRPRMSSEKITVIHCPTNVQWI